MTSPDGLEDRLRRALGAAPGDWQPDTHVAPAVLRELRRRRARRQVVLSGTVAAVVLVAGVSVALSSITGAPSPHPLSITRQSPGATTQHGASLPALAPYGADRTGAGGVACVTVGVDSVPPTCGGSFSSNPSTGPGAISSSGQSSTGTVGGLPASAPPAASAPTPAAAPSVPQGPAVVPLRVSLGQKVTIALPGRSGWTWSTPTMASAGAAKTLSRSAIVGHMRLLTRHVDPKSGALRATFLATRTGSVVLEAETASRCPGGATAPPACTQAPEQWTVVLEVVK
jgi:hypothetical protein